MVSIGETWFLGSSVASSFFLLTQETKNNKWENKQTKTRPNCFFVCLFASYVWHIFPPFCFHARTKRGDTWPRKTMVPRKWNPPTRTRPVLYAKPSQLLWECASSTPPLLPLWCCWRWKENKNSPPEPFRVAQNTASLNLQLGHTWAWFGGFNS